MATYNLRRFSKPGTLKAMNPEALLELLAPFRDFFSGRDLDLPAPGSGASVDCERLAQIFMAPDVDTPQELATALFYIHEMATPEGMDSLLDTMTFSRQSLDIGPDATPADVALKFWLHDREALERTHAESMLARPRSFESFLARQWPAPKLSAVTPETLTALESQLDDWFESRRRGRGCRVFVFPREAETWFLVRHGEPFKREGSLEKDRSSSVYFRPEKHDVLVYDPRLGELRINARSKGEKELYAKCFGERFFGDADLFGALGKYTLEPLRRDGRASLVCSDVEGLEMVILKEVTLNWGGKYRELEIRRADDLFACLEERGRSLPQRAFLRSAKFLMKFTDGKKPRMVTVRTPKTALFLRDQDSAIVDDWLLRRGFVPSRQQVVDEAA